MQLLTIYILLLCMNASYRHCTHMEGVETPLLQKQLLYHHLSGTDHLTPKDQCNTCVLFIEQVRSLYKTPNVQILLMLYMDKYFCIYIHISWWCINRRMAITARKVSDMIINARLSCLSVTSSKESISLDFPESLGNICSFVSFIFGLCKYKEQDYSHKSLLLFSFMIVTGSSAGTACLKSQ